MEQKNIIPPPILEPLLRELTPGIVRYLTIESAQQLACVNREWRNYLQAVYHARFQQDYPRLYRNLYSQIPHFVNWIEAYGLVRRKDEDDITDEATRRMFCMARDKDEDGLMAELNDPELMPYDLSCRAGYVNASEKINVLHLARRNGLRFFLDAFYMRLQLNDEADPKDAITWAMMSFLPMEDILRLFERLKSHREFEEACFVLAGSACDLGNVEVLRYVIEEQQPVFPVEMLGDNTNPLLIFLRTACSLGYTDIVRYLVENTSLNIDMAFLEPRDMYSVIECACRGGEAEILRILVENGCRITDPLYLDLLLQAESLAALRYVVEETPNGRALLEALLGYSTESGLWFWTVCRTQHVAVVDYLLQYIDLSQQIFNKFTVLDDFCLAMYVKYPLNDICVNDRNVAATLLRHGAQFMQHNDEKVVSGVAGLIHGKRELTCLMLEGYIRSLGRAHPFLKRAAGVLLQVFSSENPTSEQFDEVERFVKPFAQREGHILTVFYIEFMRQLLPSATIEQQFEASGFRMT